MHGRMHAQLLQKPALPCSRAAIYPAVVQRSTLAARCAAQADPAGPAAPSKDAEHAAKAGWDPEGLFSSASPLPRPSGDLFAARAARRAAQQKQQRHEGARLQAEQAQQAAAAAAVPQAVNVQAEPAAVELGMARSVGAPQEPASSERSIVPGPPDRQREALAATLAQNFMPVNLDHPGLELLHQDPPIFAVHDFLSPEQCAEFMESAAATGRMAASKVGSDNVMGSGSALNERRTSSSLLLDVTVTLQHATLRKLIKAAQDAAWTLTGSIPAWGAPGRMPSAGQYCFESPQVAHYQAAQHFLSHEDAFPAELAQHNGFQRHATVLIYLNDVAEGGATTFHHLGVSVQPSRGMALLFFPALADGTPDARTLHSAEAAEDGHSKWIMQQWIARGWGQARTPASAVNLASTSPVVPAKRATKQPTRKQLKSQGKKASGRKSR
eukprot:jgi/Astpho2/7414/Aster-01999